MSNPTCVQDRVRELSLDEKVAYFRGLLTSPNSENEKDILNVFRLVNSYNTFDNDFFTQEASYIKDISEFIDIKTALAKEIQDFTTEVVTWYLSLLSSCDIPLNLEQDDSKEKIPLLIYGIFLLGSLPLMSSLMNKANYEDIDMTNLHKVKEGFSVISKLFKEHTIVNFFLEKL